MLSLLQEAGSPRKHLSFLCPCLSDHVASSSEARPKDATSAATAITTNLYLFLRCRPSPEASLLTVTGETEQEIYLPQNGHQTQTRDMVLSSSDG